MSRPETLRRRTRPTRGYGNDQPSLITRASSELLQLEQLAGELIVTAFNLPPGLERRDSLMLIDSFRDRIAAMKRSGLDVDRLNAGRKAGDSAKVFLLYRATTER